MNLFVYGTLRRSVAHPMHALLRVAAYPGIVLDAGAGWVWGELYHLREPGVLEQLDAYEGAGPQDPEPREYRRIRALVERLDGEELEAWIYEYGWPTTGIPIIASGNFLRSDP